MKDLAVLNIYSIEELEASRNQRVRSAEECVTVEGKIEELTMAMDDVRKNREEYKNPVMVGKVIIRLESAINFLKKVSASFSNVANAVIAKRQDLDQKRKDTIKKLDDSKLERKAAIAAAQAKLGATEVKEPEVAVAVKKKPGRPKKA